MKSRSRTACRPRPLALLGAFLLMAGVPVALLAGAPQAAGAKAKAAAAATGPTVHIRGTAYAFFDIDDRLPGAVVRIEEYPSLEAPVASDGSYDIEVPDGATITPYIDPPSGYERIYLQTFHTSGQDLEHVNFQVVPSGIYDAFAGLLNVPVDANGQIEECAIASTFSIHEARDAPTFDPDFKDVYPHGLPDSTATITPVWGNMRGPIYFNEFVIPSPGQPVSSVDGGVVWVEVPAGWYWLEPHHPTERMSPFLVHCEKGRLVNANPPWGFYELKDGEEPDPAAMVVRPTPQKSDRQILRDQKKIERVLQGDRRPPERLFE